MTTLAVCLAGLAVLTAATLTGRRWPWKWRLPLIAVAPWLAVVAFHLAQPPTGWPATVRPNSQGAQFVWGVVREPNPSTNDHGEIDLWLIPQGMTRPRAYQLPYTRQLHRQVVAATGMVRRQGRVGLRLARRRGQHARWVAYRLPPAKAPPKTR